MAQKLALTALLLTALVAMAAATTYTTTTITTTLDEDEANQGGREQQCRQEVQRRRFHNCARYLSQGRRGTYSREDEDGIAMVNQGRTREDQSLQQCCNELQNVQRQCQCEAIRQAAQQAQQEQGKEWRGERSRGGGAGGYGGGQSEQIYRRAQDLPNRCQLSEQQCQFRLVFV
ncbi:hypothetical protein M569_03411 [Genlisea aurea]|uniref:Bifunctional inhibitor/plant lipid transfer protein/seed storage helical domain-containing protein n=1 Tax=Genlisea aurea TaxID=192259 RepID=S8EFJ8_9LAMI|nr:hypothetical protein M569_03411 [Genlisea aurea]